MYFSTQSVRSSQLNYGRSLIANFVTGLPGVIYAIKNLEDLGTKQLQNWGFVAIAVGSLLLALMGWAVNFGSGNYKANTNAHSAMFILLLLLIFVLNWGVNVSV